MRIANIPAFQPGTPVHSCNFPYYIRPDEQKMGEHVKKRLFSYPSVSTFVLSAQKNRLVETVLLSTHNICFG